MHRHRFRILVLVTALGFAPSATAQPTPAASASASPTPTEKADDLYRRARAHIDAKEWPQAFVLLWEAYQLKKSHDIVSNLGHAELRLGKYPAAATHLAQGLALLPANGQDAARERISELLAEAKEEVGTLKLVITPPDALVNVGGQRIEPPIVNGEVYVEPGEMRVEVGGVEGYDGLGRSVKVAKGQVVELALALPVRAQGVPTASATSGPAAAEPQLALVVAGGAVAGAALIAGGVMLGVGTGMQGDLQKDAPKNPDGTLTCVANPPPGGSIPACDDFRDRMRRTNAVGQAGVGLLIGGGAMAIGTLLYGLWPRSPSKAPAARLVPVATPHGAGFVMTGSF